MQNCRRKALDKIVSMDRQTAMAIPVYPPTSLWGIERVNCSFTCYRKCLRLFSHSVFKKCTILIHIHIHPINVRGYICVKTAIPGRVLIGIDGCLKIYHFTHR